MATRKKVKTKEPAESHIPISVSELFTDKSRWCKGELAKTKGNSPVAVNDAEAYKFCLSGGVECVYGRTEAGTIISRLNNIILGYTKGKFADVEDFNDHKSTRFVNVKEIVEIAGI